MYWSSGAETVLEFFKERIQRARKEHECCECEEIIPVGAEYLYSVGKWYGTISFDPLFEGYKTCLSCDKDWKTVISIFHKNGKKDACVVFGRLEAAIRDAFECNFLGKDDLLVRRWLPDVIESRTEEEIEAETWKTIEVGNVRKGLQPILPGL